MFLVPAAAPAAPRGLDGVPSFSPEALVSLGLASDDPAETARADEFLRRAVRGSMRAEAAERWNARGK